MLIATFIAGSYILLIGPSANSFGTGIVSTRCLLWGLGLPAGTKLLAAKTFSISTELGAPR
ncbi:MAG: hypothetical protein M3N82_01880 [Pseudomonadota bacterium]|nr:hypothetical protein [Pseudomonadota bacterium]